MPKSTCFVFTLSTDHRFHYHKLTYVVLSLCCQQFSTNCSVRIARVFFNNSCAIEIPGDVILFVCKYQSDVAGPKLQYIRSQCRHGEVCCLVLINSNICAARIKQFLFAHVPFENACFRAIFCALLLLM